MEPKKETLDYWVGRMEGKLDSILTNQQRQQDATNALHKRVDVVETCITSIKTDQKIFKRDVKWTVGIGAAILGIIKFVFFK